MKVKCIIKTEICNKGDFRIYACEPLGKYDNLKIHKIYGTFTITGELPYLDRGKEYEIEIEEQSTNKYGTQYSVISVPSMEFAEIRDEDEFGILCNITTARLAGFINKAYPDFVRRVLNGEEDTIDLDKIYDIGEARFKFLKRELLKKYKYLTIMSQNREFKLSIDDCKELNVRYKTLEEISKQLKEKPYMVLIEELNRSFIKADELLMEIRPDLVESDSRVEHLLRYELKLNEFKTGSTKTNAREIGINAMQYAKECTKHMKRVALASEFIYYDEDTNDMALKETYVAELQIANWIDERLKIDKKINLSKGELEKYRNVDGFDLTNEQMGTLENFCNHNLSMCVGYSGTGKTSSLIALINLIEDLGMSALYLAPTGTASARLKECIGGRVTSTIHRALMRLEEGLNCDVLVVDEFSFIGVDVMMMIVNAVNKDKTRVVFVGDNQQLESISKGRIFSDMIESGRVPMSMLTKVFRYSSGGTLKVCTDIREGRFPLENSGKAIKEGSNYTFIQCENEDEIIEEAIDVYCKKLEKSKPKDVILMSPFNVGALGTYNLNNIIQSIINPARPNEITHSIIKQSNEIKFRVGDLVLNTKNDYKAIPYDEYMKMANSEFIDEEDLALSTVYNGDFGVVRSCKENYMVIQFAEELVVYEKHKMNNLLLGYCSSVHKLQGSQRKHTISISSPCHSRMLSKQLLYVSNSRTYGDHTEIGSLDAFNSGIMVNRNIERNTFLKDLLIQG